eukprot:TRINITY_DN6875_c0_g1_i2.p1 TRINITY_DN6875_c0_g1~~TRINITY_DN6875_c0_g1_i2.p1  ORF type:complete len:112 (+),score=5.71 TRINITY_DN6875_c0_g1_i2:227-562(+)
MSLVATKPTKTYAAIITSVWFVCQMSRLRRLSVLIKLGLSMADEIVDCVPCGHRLDHVHVNTLTTHVKGARHREELGLHKKMLENRESDASAHQKSIANFITKKRGHAEEG